MLRENPLLTTMPGGEENKGNSLEEGEAEGKKLKKGKLSHLRVIQLLKTGEWWPSLWLRNDDGCESR